MNKYKLLFLALPLLAVSFLRTGGLVFAETMEISVSGNGDSSQSQATVNNSSNTTVTQSNTAEVNNEVMTNNNTGNNSANSNSGDANIITGDAQSITTVKNTNINQSVADCSDGCQTNVVTSQVNIADNNSNSSNNVNVGGAINSNVNQGNVADITNQVTTNANTGENNAKHNNGNVEITTGNIAATTTILNKNINSNKTKGFGVVILDQIFNITGNGDGSKNAINYNLTSSFNYSQKNEFNLTNLVFNNLNTGENNANHNNGDVKINTGDIISFTTIENSGNDNVIITPTPGSTCKENCGGNNVPPSTTTSGGSNGGGSSSSEGGSSSNPAVLGATTLPATGSIWLYIMTLLSLILLLTGWYLRFTTGVSPPVKA